MKKKILNSLNLKSTVFNVCSECGLEANRLTCIQKYGSPPKIPCFECSTFHMADCDSCGKHKWVTEVRDYFFPDFGLLSEEFKNKQQDEKEPS